MRNRLSSLAWLLVAAFTVVPATGQTIINTEVQPVPVPVDIKAELANTISGLNDVIVEVETGVRLFDNRASSETLSLEQEFQIELLLAQRAWVVSLRDRVRAIYRGAEGNNLHPHQLSAQMQLLSGFYGAQQEQNQLWAGELGLNLSVDLQTLPPFRDRSLSTSGRLGSDQIGPTLARTANGLKGLYWIQWYGDGMSDDLNKWSLGTHIALFWNQIATVEIGAHENGIPLTTAQLAALDQIGSRARSLIHFRMLDCYPPYRQAFLQLSPTDGSAMSQARPNDARAFEAWDRWIEANSRDGHPREPELRAQLWLTAKLIPSGVYRGSGPTLEMPNEASDLYQQALNSMLGAQPEESASVSAR